MCKIYIEKFDENAASKAMNNKYVLFSSLDKQNNWYVYDFFTSRITTAG